MADLWTTICNSICLILEAISRFDIMAVDTQKLALSAETIAHIGRAVYHLIRIIEIIVINVR